MLTILGGGGWAPAHGRHTACALIRRGPSAIMIDTGTGVARALERPELFSDLERLDIVLTHFHLDHIAGLAYLAAVGLSDRTTLWGPGKLLYGTPTEAVLDRVTREPFHPVPLREQRIVVRDLPAAEIELAGLTVRTRRQDRHSIASLAFRFGDELTWITDTAYDPESATFASGCKLLAHECWFPAAAPRNPDIHSSATEAASIARDAGAETLLLIHLPPFEASVDPLAREAQAVMPAVRVGLDGLELAEVGAV